MAFKRLGAADAMFLLLESRETMMHVGSLLPFTPAPGAPPDHLRTVVEEVRATRDLAPPWNLKLRTPGFMKNPLHTWVEDRDVDVDYHVRRSALPAPGDERELGVLVSRLHGNPLDFTRPPWEVHFIEGLERGRFALYAKVHHALVDGFTAMRILARSMSIDPDARDARLFVSLPSPGGRPERAVAREAAGVQFPELLKGLREQLGSSRELGRAVLDVLRNPKKRADELVTPLMAPRSILNGPITRHRRFATQLVPVDRMKTLAARAGGTLNDVVLALSGGALRRFLAELDALPAEPLVAMLPVNIRPKDDPGGGNAVGAILATLATHLPDPGARMAAIVGSTKRAKQQLEGMSKQAIFQYSALLMAPFGLQGTKLTAGRVRPGFNVVISNVRGPDTPLYFRGARLEACYPVSIPVHGMALNITCSSYAGNFCFGFIGCRDTLPHLQHLAVYCGEELAALESALA